MRREPLIKKGSIHIIRSIATGSPNLPHSKAPRHTFSNGSMSTPQVVANPLRMARRNFTRVT